MKTAMMMSLLLVLVGCGAAESPPSPSPPRGSFTAADRVAIARVLGDQMAAWNRGDLDAYMAGYVHSNSLVFTSGAKVRTGYDETLAAYRKRYGNDRASMGTLEFNLLRVDPVGSDGAVVLGRWDLALVGGPVGGIFSVVLERQGDGWRIIHDHTSADPSPPSPPSPP
jgi:ketosteroid isomerase-like protein